MSINRIITRSYSLPPGLNYRVPMKALEPSPALRKALDKLYIDPTKPFYSPDQADKMLTSSEPSYSWQESHRGRIVKTIFLLVSLGLGFAPLIYAIGIDPEKITPFLSYLTWITPPGGIILALVWLCAMIDDDGYAFLKNPSPLSAADRAAFRNFTMDFYKSSDFDAKFARIAYSAVYACKGIYESPLWDNPNYELGIPQTDLQEVLRNILSRVDTAQKLHYRNQRMRRDIPRHTHKSFSVGIDDTLKSVCKEIEELQKYRKNLKKMEREYRKIERLPDAIKLGDDIHDAMASSESNYALQSFRYETPMLSGTIDTLKKIAEEMYDSTLIFDPKAALKGRK